MNLEDYCLLTRSLLKRKSTNRVIIDIPPNRRNTWAVEGKYSPCGIPLRVVRSTQKRNEKIQYEGIRRAILIDEIYIESVVFLSVICAFEKHDSHDDLYYAFVTKHFSDIARNRGYANCYTGLQSLLRKIYSKINRTMKKDILRLYNTSNSDHFRAGLVSYVLGHEMTHATGESKNCAEIRKFLENEVSKRWSEIDSTYVNLELETDSNPDLRQAAFLEETLADYSGLVESLIWSQYTLDTNPSIDQDEVSRALKNAAGQGTLWCMLIYFTGAYSQINSFTQAQIDSTYDQKSGHTDYRHISIRERHRVFSQSGNYIADHHGISSPALMFNGNYLDQVVKTSTRWSNLISDYFVRYPEVADLFNDPDSRAIYSTNFFPAYSNDVLSKAKSIEFNFAST